LRPSVWLVGLALLAGACASSLQPGVAGPYQTWDDVINRWIGAKKTDLYYELGPPTFHPPESEDGYALLVWDMTIPGMPGRAREYDLLPRYGAIVDCKLEFLADSNRIIKSGPRIGCD
jgi:hypothetical protein